MDFKISISIPPDNPPISQVDHLGHEQYANQLSRNEKFVQLLNQIRHQKEIELQKLNEEKSTKEQQQIEQQSTNQQISIQGPNPMQVFYDHINMARIELESLLYLIDMIKNDSITLNNNDKPSDSEIQQTWDLTSRIAIKQQSLNNVSSKLKLGASRMKETIKTMSGWWNDVSTLRTKWRLKGKDQQSSTIGVSTSPMMGIGNQQGGKSNKRLSIDYGYYTSGSLIEQTEADLSRGPNGEINIDFPNLPYQASINKRLYINIKSSDSKTFYNHSSSLKKIPSLKSNSALLASAKQQSQSSGMPRTPNSSSSTLPTSSAFNKLRQQQQIQLLQQQQILQQQQQSDDPDDPEELHRKFILNCTNQLNKAQKYQFNFEIFDQLSKEVTSGSLSSGGIGSSSNINNPGSNNPSSNQNQPSPNIPQSNIAGGTFSSMMMGSNNPGGSSLSLTSGGENIMLTEKEIRIECGNFNLFIGMDNNKKDKDQQQQQQTTASSSSPNSNINIDKLEQLSLLNNCNTNRNIIFTDEEKNRLLFVLKTILKKISVLQLKRSQKQLTMNLSRRTPRIIFGKKIPPISHNDDIIFKITSIVKHMDTYLRVYKILEIFEMKLPIRLKSTPAAESFSSLFILNLIDSSQNIKNPMVTIEISINQNKIDVVQGQNRSFSNKDEVIVGNFIINLIRSYFINNNIHPSHLDLDYNDEEDENIEIQKNKKFKLNNNINNSNSNNNNNNNFVDDNDRIVNNLNIINKHHQIIDKYFKSLIYDISNK